VVHRGRLDLTASVAGDDVVRAPRVIRVVDRLAAHAAKGIVRGHGAWTEPGREIVIRGNDARTVGIDLTRLVLQLDAGPERAVIEKLGIESDRRIVALVVLEGRIL